MPFKPGQSGNAGGRPKGWAEVNALARQHNGAAIEALVKSLGDRRTRVQAAQVLLDRGWGKPALAIDMATGPPPTANQFLQCCSEGLDRLSVAELHQLIELIQKMEGTPEEAVDDADRPSIAASFVPPATTIPPPAPTLAPASPPPPPAPPLRPAQLRDQNWLAPEKSASFPP